MRRSFQFAFHSVDIQATQAFTHTHHQLERDKILIRNTSQRRLDNQDDNDVESEQSRQIICYRVEKSFVFDIWFARSGTAGTKLTLDHF